MVFLFLAHHLLLFILISLNSFSSSLDMWHKHFGHCASDVIKKALDHCNIFFHSIKDYGICLPCSVSKVANCHICIRLLNTIKHLYLCTVMYGVPYQLLLKMALTIMLLSLIMQANLLGYLLKTK